jgi:formamidopyrimidine-DNA glycosylase
MPELPEVEAARVLATRAARGRRVGRVWCADDPIVFERVPALRFRRALTGRRILNVHRHGKHLWFELDGRPWPCFHFGMSGGLHVPDRKSVKLKSSRIRAAAAWPPRFTKLRLTLDDGNELVYADARRLGRIRLRHDPAAEPPISLLGFDALVSVPATRAMADVLATRAAPIKAVLLDQAFSAGVGNWIADEVLYQARIAPDRPARSLSLDDVRRLRAAIKLVIGLAVRVGADGDKFPRGWLFHYRWGKAAGAITARGERIRFDTIGGRTTAWAPSVQK